MADGKQGEVREVCSVVRRSSTTAVWLTKFWSFSRKAQSLAAHESSLSRHQPEYRGSLSGAAVLLPGGPGACRARLACAVASPDESWRPRRC
jgi:hypothetical protein